MDKKTTESAKKALCELLTKCVDISNGTKAACFMDYEPHLNSYSVFLHRDGWSPTSEAEWIAMCKAITKDNVMATLEKLEKICEELEGKENV